MNPFEVGRTYRRISDIHGHYGGQRQGGISTPSDHPYVFLFTGDAGENYGYRDGFKPDGTFWYTGEGQVGDMKMERGNAAIRNHHAAGKTLILFEYEAKGWVRCLGEATYLAHHTEQRPDRNGDMRDAIVFELDLVAGKSEVVVEKPESPDPSDRSLRLWSRPLSEVRELARAVPSPRVSEKTRKVITRQRSEAVKVYVLRRAKGVCESCHHPAPFVAKGNRPYLEPHHIHRLADGGPDSPDSVAAVCPNCHREIHHGVNGKARNDDLARRIKAMEMPHE